jgi:hypothetical protein
MALQIHAQVFTSRAMRKRYMIVSNIIKEVEFGLVEHQACSYAVYWRISPSFVKEAARLVEVLKVVHVGFGSKPIEVANFKV